MSPEMKLEKGLKSDLVSKLAACEVDGCPSDSDSAIPSLRDAKAEVDAAFSTKSEINKGSAGKNGVYGAPANGYNYYYPGYGGSFTQFDGHGYFQPDGSHAGIQTENGSMLYYMPGFGPYASGPVVDVNGQSINQQYYSSAGYLQTPVSYGTEAVPYYPFESTYFGDVSSRNGDHGTAKYSSGSTLSKSNGLNSVNSNGHAGSKFNKPTYAQPMRSLNKVSPVGSDISAGVLKGNQPSGKFSFMGQKHGQFLYSSPMNYRQNGRLWHGNDRYRSRDKFSKDNGYESSPELTCGPRAAKKNGPNDDTTKKDDLEITVPRERYNVPDLQTEYTSAKFYVIKSYNEDDIHKSIKYDVWSSTPNGNKKLDAAYCDAELKSNDTGTKCPIFLFFSVNGSGQFVGVAEMVGKVDFNKDMDFWQLDKWSGFFPLKWHIVKDIPNSQLRHIILENNEGRAVTYSRDTQEIGLKQGMEMLNIFKSNSSKTSLLDDFSFYENREKSLHAKKSNKPATIPMEAYQNGNFYKHTNGERNFIDDSRTKILANPSALITLTKNLTLNSYNPKINGVKKPTENLVPAIPSL